MAAIGAAPVFGRPNFPQRSGYFPSGVQLDLVPFGEASLLHFLYLERPEGMERQDADGFVPSAPPREPLSEDELMPRGQEFMTVGHLYRGIEEGLRTLTDRFGERAVFVGSPRAQATPELLRWPQLIAVTGLDSALAAVGEIIEQGEGRAGPLARRALRPLPLDVGGVPRLKAAGPVVRAGAAGDRGVHAPAVRHPRARCRSSPTR